MFISTPLQRTRSVPGISADVLSLMSRGSPKNSATAAPQSPCGACGATPSTAVPLLEGFWEVHCEFWDTSGPGGGCTQGTVIVARCATCAAAEASMMLTLREYPVQPGPQSPHPGGPPPDRPGVYQVWQIGREPPVYRTVGAQLTEKWYVTYCKARIHAEDVAVQAEPLGVSPWRSLYQPHHVLPLDAPFPRDSVVL